MIREFETETDRVVWICLDATASMAYRSDRAPASKLAYAGLVASALARVALASGDPVGLRWVGGDRARPLPAVVGLGAFERIVGSIESAVAGGDLSADRQVVLQSLAPTARKGRRGAAVVLFSDLLDLPESARHDFVSAAPRPRALVVVRVLDPVERGLSMTGAMRLRALEGTAVVDTDVDAVRPIYLDRLANIASLWSKELATHGGRFLDATTDEDATQLTRSILFAIADAGG
jgi:uncharacterized protein (DUF58 family)